MLKLIGWCKHIPANIGNEFKSRVFSRENFSTLLKLGCIATDKTGRAYRLTPSGNSLLQRLGYDFPFEAKPRNEEGVIERRLASARSLITFYRAGISVFNDNPESLEPGEFMPSFALRRDKAQKSSRLNSTVFIGAYAACTAKKRGSTEGAAFAEGKCTEQEALYVVFNVAGSNNSVYYANEMKTFNGLFNENSANRSVIFMGGSTAGIAKAALNGDTARLRNGSYSFAGVYENTTLPVHFIPTNDDGALMLKLMRLENYREAVASALLPVVYKPPYDGFYETDTIHRTHRGYYEPAAVTADMDVKRLDRVAAKARGAGYGRAVFYLLPEQAEFMRERYEKNGDITLLFDMEPFLERMGERDELFEVEDEPFVTGEGKYAPVLLDF